MSTAGRRWTVLSWDRGSCRECGSISTTCCLVGQRDQHRWRASAVRMYVLGWLGGRCEICQIDDPLMLELAHREPVRRSEWGKGTPNLAIRLGEEATRRVFRCLCANHHRAETYLHQEWRSTKIDKTVVQVEGVPNPTIREGGSALNS